MIPQVEAVMKFPERFANLPVATWPRLRGLLDVVQPGGDVINMPHGEPQHDFPDFVGPAMTAAMGGFRGYPDNTAHQSC